jgi:hypothetical protein
MISFGRLTTAATVVLVMCTNSAPLQAQTQGELFRKLMAAEHERCREAGRGPYAPPENRGDNRRGVFNSDCDLLLLETPQDPMATEEGRQAHAIKLPAPHDKPKEVYKAGMSSAAYFRALCEAEAGEFIFKTVDNVEGVFEMRPRTKAPRYGFQHLYYLEDPYGHFDFDASKSEFALVGPELYEYVERKSNTGDSILHFTGYNRQQLNTMRQSTIPTRTTRYGYTWRGIKRQNDREMGIAGGELIVIDLDTSEVLGFRRGFARTGIGTFGANWEFPSICPDLGYHSGRSRFTGFDYWILGKIVRNKNHEIRFKKLRGEVPMN